MHAAAVARREEAMVQKAAREKAQLLDSERTLREQMRILQEGPESRARCLKSRATQSCS